MNPICFPIILSLSVANFFSGYMAQLGLFVYGLSSEHCYSSVILYVTLHRKPATSEASNIMQNAH